MRLITDYLWGVLTVWMESRGESYKGKVAVAEVIQRRTKRKFCSNGTVASTCLWPLQFSAWNTRDPNRIKAATLDTADPGVNDCVRAWMDAERGPDIVPEAMHYLNEKLVMKLYGKLPNWVGRMTKVAEIDHHSFYSIGG